MMGELNGIEIIRQIMHEIDPTLFFMEENFFVQMLEAYSRTK